MKDKVNATIDIKELQEKMCCQNSPVWKEIPIVYAMLGWIFTLGGGAFFALSIYMLAMGITMSGWYIMIEPEAMVLYSILAILIGAVFTGLSHIEDW
jgi:hypothetical protein